MNALNKIHHIYFIGIGGVSMSSLAKYCKMLGKNVSGSDLMNNEKTQELMSLGIKVNIGHDSKNIPNKTELVVINSAININNCEYQYAKKQQIPIIERAEFLAIISNMFENIIAISGSHGKTTTTSLIGYIFYNAGLMPFTHIGGNVINKTINKFSQEKRYFITEACEYKKNFLFLHPNSTIITNIDWDHTDCYSSLKDVENVFQTLIEQTKYKVFYFGDKFNKKILSNINTKTISFGFEKYNDYYAQISKIYQNGTYKFDVFNKHKKLFSCKSNLIGKYNILNELCAIAVALEYKIDVSIIKQSIETFYGVERRFEFIKKIGKSKIYIDYAHHPKEIQNLLRACKTLTYNKTIVVFQPHTYSRTKSLFNEFLVSFVDCDELALIPTYPAREEIIIGGRSEDLYDEIKRYANE